MVRKLINREQVEHLSPDIITSNLDSERPYDNIIGALQLRIVVNSDRSKGKYFENSLELLM